MAKGTGYGQFHLTMIVQVMKPYDSGLVGRSDLKQISDIGIASMFSWSLKGKLRDDETIVDEWSDIARDHGVPSGAWQILWDESDWQKAG